MIFELLFPQFITGVLMIRLYVTKLGGEPFVGWGEIRVALELGV
jgi:hypothetical protein